MNEIKKILKEVSKSLEKIKVSIQKDNKDLIVYEGYVLDIDIKNNKVYISPHPDPPIYYLYGLIIGIDRIKHIEVIEEE